MKYKVTLVYKQEYNFEDIEASSEEEAEQKAQELVKESSPSDAWLYDSKVEETR